jgi:GT2 family glycosyltransferase
MDEYIDCHGTYNLAIRRSVLEKLGGFNEKYKKPSGEDFDLTYKVSRLGKIKFVREARVGHDHPRDFWAYMKNQFQRGIDRVRLYADNPAKIKNDSYTEWLVKYEVILACMVIAIAPFAVLINVLRLPLIFTLILLFFLSSRRLPFLMQEESVSLGLYGTAIHFARTFAWALGLQFGLISRMIER